ncbi:DUF6069 family protein [Spirillospora sp. NPDC049024]
MSGGNTARRALTVAGGAAAALALWAAAGPVAGLDLAAETGGEVRPVGAGPVVAAGLIVGLAAWGLLAVLERATARPGRVWTTVAAAVLVLSMIGPLGGAADGASMAVLAGMHLVVAAVLIPGLGRSARPAALREPSTQA